MWTPGTEHIITAEQRASEAAAAARKAQFHNLEPDQFWFVVRASGFEQTLTDWVAAMNDAQSPTYDPVGWAAASAKLQFAKFFERDHPFVEEARQAIGMTEAELDALWAFGAS
jgi:hypothetical protein